MAEHYIKGPVLIPTLEEVEELERAAERRRHEQERFDQGFAEYERRLEDERLEDLALEEALASTQQEPN